MTGVANGGSAAFLVAPWHLALVCGVAVERLAELLVSVRHARWARARGGVERGRRHYRVMVVVHAGLLAGAVVETGLCDRPFVPALGWPALAVTAVAQVLRWWCVRSLGPCWNTRVIVVPGLALSTRGPYRWLRHPNYLVVAVEGIALPLVHSAWLTALAFTVVNAAVLTVRLRVENAALELAR
ncbi:isoprenylcysteine carboxyl methyltransferase family protein [Streptomyces sp. CA-250714]|uniref:isoprenylcysteine carboxyl methyltransferase family protein n=1 Tax=Streptomyces sp. CA-250714 TaxID=3240060 RepID=UPI003D94CCAF